MCIRDSTYGHGDLYTHADRNAVAHADRDAVAHTDGDTDRDAVAHANRHGRCIPHPDADYRSVG